MINVPKDKLLESDVLVQKVKNNSKGQFLYSPELSSDGMSAIKGAL